MNPVHAQAELDEKTLRFTVVGGCELREGDTLIVRRVSSEANALCVEAVPEKAVREAVAKLFT